MVYEFSFQDQPWLFNFQAITHIKTIRCRHFVAFSKARSWQMLANEFFYINILQYSINRSPHLTVFVRKNRCFCWLKIVVWSMLRWRVSSSISIFKLNQFYVGFTVSRWNQSFFELICNIDVSNTDMIKIFQFQNELIKSENLPFGSVVSTASLLAVLSVLASTDKHKIVMAIANTYNRYAILYFNSETFWSCFRGLDFGCFKIEVWECKDGPRFYTGQASYG